MTIAEKTKGYSQMSSGFWTNLEDGSSPYLFDGNNMIFLSNGGGGSVNVLGSELAGLSVVNEKVADGDTLLSSIGKLQGQVDAVPTPMTEPDVRNVKLTGLSTSDITEINADDTILKALGKSQAQVDQLQTAINEILMRLKALEEV